MSSLSLSHHRSERPAFPALGVVALALLALVAAASLVAQVAGERGIAPVASSTDIEVRGIEVNTTGKNAEEARLNGWKRAQRLAWERIEGPDISDSQLEGLVSAIVVEEEQIGPRRYIARLGVIFDRQRAGGLLGADGEHGRSAPMLTLPVLRSGGTETMFEVRNPWQRAWAEYQAGGSTIDYVRPNGAGGESLLLTYGQTGRRSRAWWNNILDQFSAADVLVPIADLNRTYPGGPIEGRFTARFGPDNRFLDSFTMRAENESELPAMLERAVRRFDEIFGEALASGVLRPDPTLTLDNLELTDQIRALIEASRQAEAAEIAGEAGIAATVGPDAAVPDSAAPVTPTTATFTVQVATPDARGFDAALSGVRGAAGVRGVSVSSTAIGGTSVLQVTFTGDLAQLAASLRAGGWTVVEGSNALAISR